MSVDSKLKIAKIILGLMFCISGFCALLYQTVWLRLAFAEFGVITPVVSLIVSTFMLNLGLGSWLGGHYAARLKTLSRHSVIIFYGIIEMFIGIGAFLVPDFFKYGSSLWTSAGEINSWFYLLSSALVIVFSIFPFAFAMGMTFPVVLEFLREYKSEDSDPGRFSFLYTANTQGACLGAILTVFMLIEMLGFRKTLMFGAFGNFLIAAIAIIWGVRIGQLAEQSPSTVPPSVASIKPDSQKLHNLLILFTTGFCSMAMEVVWVRSFTPHIGTLVYSFATLLAAYLLSNWFGVLLYRLALKKARVLKQDTLLALAVVFSCLPLLASNPAFFKPFLESGDNFNPGLLIFLSIMPFSAVLGYLAPLIIDEWSGGNPSKAGKAYAFNILGCVLGPLFAGYLTLPFIGARISLVLLSIPLLLLYVFNNRLQGKAAIMKLAIALTVVLTLFSACFWLSWEEGAQATQLGYTDFVIHRDYAATTISMKQNDKKTLTVNGQVMTGICRGTKFMAYLPLAFHNNSPKSVLIICFGMGTTFRSALNWPGVAVTAVELVPGVKDAFDYYYPDAKAVLANPNGRIVIDDGRRFLRRTAEKFDVITVDPPPPWSSIASSLLYSKEFFDLAKSHLNPGGILQEWYGFESEEPMKNLLLSLKKEFRYIRMFKFTEKSGARGWYFLASDSPINSLSSEEFYNRLPEKAIIDLEEPLNIDGGKYLSKEEIKKLLSHEASIDSIPIPKRPRTITDDRPYNEYFLVHSTLEAKQNVK